MSHKVEFLFALVFCALASIVSADTCDLKNDKLFDNLEFVDMKSKCTLLTEDQVKKEITASLKYLSMAAHFSQDNVNRPGFAKFFFDAASEEREHALKLIEYLQMRGRYFDLENSEFANMKIGHLVRDSEKATALGLDAVWTAPLKARDNKVSAGLDSLKTALKMEYAVTTSIRELIKACEAEKLESNTDEYFNDYHFVDYLTGEFLTEQYHGKRDIAGKISTLGKMIKDNGAELADFIFDQKLL